MLVGGVLAGQLYNVVMLACADMDDLGDFMHDTFVPTVRIAATVLLSYWLWQETNVRSALRRVAHCSTCDPVSVCRLGRQQTWQVQAHAEGNTGKKAANATVVAKPRKTRQSTNKVQFDAPSAAVETTTTPVRTWLALVSCPRRGA